MSSQQHCMGMISNNLLLIEQQEQQQQELSQEQRQLLELYSCYYSDPEFSSIRKLGWTCCQEEDSTTTSATHNDDSESPCSSSCRSSSSSSSSSSSLAWVCVEKDGCKPNESVHSNKTDQWIGVSSLANVRCNFSYYDGNYHEEDDDDDDDEDWSIPSEITVTGTTIISGSCPVAEYGTKSHGTATTVSSTFHTLSNSYPPPPPPPPQKMETESKTLPGRQQFESNWNDHDNNYFNYYYQLDDCRNGSDVTEDEERGIIKKTYSEESLDLNAKCVVEDQLDEFQTAMSWFFLLLTYLICAGYLPFLTICFISWSIVELCPRLIPDFVLRSVVDKNTSSMSYDEDQTSDEEEMIREHLRLLDSISATVQRQQQHLEERIYWSPSTLRMKHPYQQALPLQSGERQGTTIHNSTFSSTTTSYSTTSSC